MEEGCLFCTTGNSKYVRYNGFIPRIHHQIQAPESSTSTSTCFILRGITGKKHDEVYSSFVERIKKNNNKKNYRKRKMYVILCVCISTFTYINIYLFLYFTVDNPENKYHFNTSNFLCYLDPQALSFLNSTQQNNKIKLCEKQYLFRFFQKHLRRVCFK